MSKLEERAAAIDPCQFDWIDIKYSTSDRFGVDQDGDPHNQFAQYVNGEISGAAVDGDEGSDVPIGTLSLAVIDLYEAQGQLFEVLDSASSEWCRYAELVEEEEHEKVLTHLLILDRIELAPEVRGHGVGLHVLARAIRTWASSEALVVLTAWPPGEKGQGGQRGGAGLARYWSRLALRRAETDGDPPILVGWRGINDGGAVDKLCQWQPRPITGRPA